MSNCMYIGAQCTATKVQLRQYVLFNQYVGMSPIRIAILYKAGDNRPEIDELIENVRGFKVTMLDINDPRLTCKLFHTDFHVFINRVYPSVIRDPALACSALLLIHAEEARSLVTLPNLEAARADYSKFRSARIMRQHGILTPKTVKFNPNKISDQVSDLGGFPVVVKRDCGGRSVGNALAANVTELLAAVEAIQWPGSEFRDEDEDDCWGGVIVQEFLKTTETADYRVTVINGEVVQYFRRDFISINDEDPWVASMSGGSGYVEKTGAECPTDVARLAIFASRTITADLTALISFGRRTGWPLLRTIRQDNFFPAKARV
eukprot:180518_1